MERLRFSEWCEIHEWLSSDDDDGKLGGAVPEGEEMELALEEFRARKEARYAGQN
jgi:hypothetical protein